MNDRFHDEDLEEIAKLQSLESVTMKTMLWLTLVVAAFFAGAAWQKRRSEAEQEQLARFLNEALLNQDAVFIQQTIERRPKRP